MVSQSIETDGHGFCVGLEAALDVGDSEGRKIEGTEDAEEPLLTDRIQVNTIRSTVYLIKDASLRPKRAIHREDRFSLNVCTLRELLDLYRDRKASDRRDKLFAVIGMSSDVAIPTTLLPDYKTAWPELFRRLFKSIVGEGAVIKTWDSGIAVARGRGWVIGHVKQGNPRPGCNKLDVEITPTLLPLFPGGDKLTTLNLTAMSARVDDAICVLEGSTALVIIRPQRDYWTVVSVGVGLVDVVLGTGHVSSDTCRHLTHNESIEFISSLSSPYCDNLRQFSCDLVLVWDWEPQPGSEEHRIGQSLYLTDLLAGRLPEHARNEALAICSDDTSRLINMALGHAAANRGKAACTIFRDVAESLVIDPEAGRLSLVLETAKTLSSWCHKKCSPCLRAMADIIGWRGPFCDSGQDALLCAIRLDRRYSASIMSLLDLLFKRSGVDIQVTGAALEYAAGERVHSTAVALMQRLLSHGDGCATIPSGVMIAALWNSNCSSELITVLLGQDGVDIEITEEVIKVALAQASAETIRQLFNRFGHRITVNADMLTAAGTNYMNENDIKWLVQFLLDHPSRNIDITLPTLKQFARGYGSKELLKQLFGRYGADVMIAGGVVEAVAAEGPSDTMEFLLDKSLPRVQMTESLVVAAAGNPRTSYPGSHDSPMLQFFLKRWGTEVKVTEAVLMAALKAGPSRLRFLFDQRSREVNVTEDILMAAIEETEWAGRGLMELILARFHSQISISQRIAKAAVSLEREAKDLVQLLLLRQGGSWVTEDVVKAAIGNNGHQGREALGLLFETSKMKGKATLDMIQYTVDNQHDAIDILLSNLPIERLGEAAAILQDVLGTEDGAFVSNLLFEQQVEILEVTKEFLDAISTNERAFILICLLLKSRGPGYKLAEEVILAAAANQKQGTKLIDGIINRGIVVDLTEGVAIVAAGNECCGLRLFQFLTAHMRMKITSLKYGIRDQAILKNLRQAILETGKVEEAARRNVSCGMEILKLLHHDGTWGIKGPPWLDEL